MRCGRRGGSCCGAPDRKSSKIKAVAVLRLDGGRPMPTGLRAINTAGRERAPCLTWGKRRQPRVNTLRAHRITEGLVDNKILLNGAYSEVDQPAVRSIEK